MSQVITPVKRFWRLLRPEKREITNIYVYAAFNGLVNLSLPIGIQSIINFIQGGQISTSWIVLVTFVILGVAVSGTLQVLQLRISENLQQRIFARSAFEFAFRIPRIRQEAFDKHYAPELMNRFFDTVSVQKGLSKILIDFSLATLQVFFGLILLSLYHPFFILFSMTLLLLLYFIFRLTVKRGLRTSLEESKHKYEVAHWLEELARTATTFKLAGNTDLPLKRTDRDLHGYLAARESHFKTLVGQYSLMVIFKVLVATGLLAIGGVLVMEQQMNIGQFVAAEIIILLIMGSVEKLILSFETIYDVLTSLEKIGQVTDLALENPEGAAISDHPSNNGLSVDLENVSFSYSGYGKKVIHDLSLSIESGERLMITGGNGEGKSTLLRIMAGLYQLPEGMISWNGVSMGNIDLTALRSVIGDCFSEEQVFKGTVLENITMGRPAVSFDDVQWAAEKMGLSDFIRRLPKGYDTVLDPLGRNLPRSVFQRLLMARSIADHPKLLLMEDAFEHFNDDERRRLIDFLTDKENPWTLVAVSSDPYLASKCHRIAVIENGKVVRTGTANQLNIH